MSPDSAESTHGLDAATIREDFPIYAEPINGKQLIYLVSASTSQKPAYVLDEMRNFYETSNANVHRGAYYLSDLASRRMEAARGSVARFIGAPDVDEVVFTKNATESLNLLAGAWGRANLSQGDVVVLSVIEHHANIVPWHKLAAERGNELRFIPVGDARMLDLSRAVVPDMASVMSAWGMLATKLRFEATRSHVGETDQVNVDELREIYAQMERDGRARMSDWFDGPIEILRSADMRYGEQIHEIDVPLDGINLDAENLPAALKAAFERRHETLYTYSLQDQQPVLVNARVATVGNLPLPADEPRQVTSGASAEIGERQIYLQGWRRVPAFEFSALMPGQIINGAAIVESPTTTVLLRDGDVATVTSQGWLDIAVGDPAPPSA